MDRWFAAHEFASGVFAAVMQRSGTARVCSSSLVVVARGLAQGGVAQGTPVHIEAIDELPRILVEMVLMRSHRQLVGSVSPTATSLPRGFRAFAGRASHIAL